LILVKPPLTPVTPFFYVVTSELTGPIGEQSKAVGCGACDCLTSSLQVSGVYEGIIKAHEASHEGTVMIQEGVDVAKKRAVEAGAAPESCQVYTSGDLPNQLAPVSLSCRAPAYLLS
jgi:hypothetical protein